MYFATDSDYSSSADTGHLLQIDIIRDLPLLSIMLLFLIVCFMTSIKFNVYSACWHPATEQQLCILQFCCFFISFTRVILKLLSRTAILHLSSPFLLEWRHNLANCCTRWCPDTPLAGPRCLCEGGLLYRSCLQPFIGNGEKGVMRCF